MAWVWHPRSPSLPLRTWSSTCKHLKPPFSSINPIQTMGSSSKLGSCQTLPVRPGARDLSSSPSSRTEACISHSIHRWRLIPAESLTPGPAVGAASQQDRCQAGPPTDGSLVPLERCHRTICSPDSRSASAEKAPEPTVGTLSTPVSPALVPSLPGFPPLPQGASPKSSSQGRTEAKTAGGTPRGRLGRWRGSPPCLTV